MQIWLYQFTIQALNTIDFGGFNGSALRGGFGDVLRKLTCHTGLTDCTGCPSFRNCPFTRIFNIAPPENDPHFKSETQVPRPFIIDAMKEKALSHGQIANFRIGLVGRANEDLPYFVVSFQQLGKLGIGRGRGKFKLLSVSSIDPLHNSLPVCIFDADKNLLSPSIAHPIQIVDLLSKEKSTDISAIRLVFDSPAHLNRKGQAPQEPPDFEVLLRSVLRRYSDLASLYGEGRPDINYKELVDNSKVIKLTNSNIKYQVSRSYSQRKQAITPLAGITGSLDFSGNMSPFMPYLIFGQWLHIGKQATFGMGQYHLEVLN
jgi:hypothetical protein